MKLQTAASKFGNGLLDVMDAVHQSNIRSQIEEITKEQNMLRSQMTELQEKKDELKKKLS